MRYVYSFLSKISISDISNQTGAVFALGRKITACAFVLDMYFHILNELLTLILSLKPTDVLLIRTAKKWAGYENGAVRRRIQ